MARTDVSQSYSVTSVSDFDMTNQHLFLLSIALLVTSLPLRSPHVSISHNLSIYCLDTQIETASMKTGIVASRHTRKEPPKKAGRVYKKNKQQEKQTRKERKSNLSKRSICPPTHFFSFFLFLVPCVVPLSPQYWLCVPVIPKRQHDRPTWVTVTVSVRTLKGQGMAVRNPL